jgi:hypothetical protein
VTSLQFQIVPKHAGRLALPVEGGTAESAGVRASQRHGPGFNEVIVDGGGTWGVGIGWEGRIGVLVSGAEETLHIALEPMEGEVVGGTGFHDQDPLPGFGELAGQDRTRNTGSHHHNIVTEGSRFAGADKVRIGTGHGQVK